MDLMRSVQYEQAFMFAYRYVVSRIDEGLRAQCRTAGRHADSICRQDTIHFK